MTYLLALALLTSTADLPGADRSDQVTAPAPTPASPGAVVPVTITPPIYPPIAQSARVSGEVDIDVLVRPDGSVEAVKVVAGRGRGGGNPLPLLQEAALAAARTSHFTCEECDAPVAHLITFVFVLDGGPPRVGPATSVSPTRSRVAIFAESPVVGPEFATYAVRSPKCLYLWRCGSRWGGLDWYFYPVRSPKCLWLWGCGWKRREQA